MDNIIIKTSTLRDHPGCKVLLEEMQDGRKHVRKLHTNTQYELTDKFAKLLYDLHNIIPNKTPLFGGFIQNELEEIKTIIEKKNINEYLEIHNSLTVLSTDIKEHPPCYVWRFVI
jgi:hypothetical protein